MATPDYVRQYSRAGAATVLQQYNGARNQVASKFADPVQRQAALNAFDSDPRAQAMRKVAGLAPVSTVQGDVQAAAKQSLASRASDFLAATEAGGDKALFSIPERLTAALHYYLPNSGEALDPSQPEAPQGKTYSEQFANERAFNDQQAARSPIGDILGQVLGSVTGLGLAGKAIGAGATRLAASEAPVLAKAGNVLQNLGTLQKGQIVRNAGRAAVAGSAVGAAQAAGEGGDIPTGAAVGAATGGALQGLGSLAGKFLLQPAADVLGLSNAGDYLKRFTTASVDSIAQKVADFRAKTGADPTLFQVLPLADRNSLMKNTVAGRDPVVEQVSKAIADRTANIQPEMTDTVNGATQQQRLLTQRQMVSDLAAANGGTNVPGDASLALRASQSPTDMLALRRIESQRIMAPHDNSQVVGSASDLIPQYPVNVTTPARQIPVTSPDSGIPLVDASGNPVIRTIPGKTEIQMRDANSEISRAINAVSGGLSLRPPGNGINVGEVTDMISKLREVANEGDIVNRSAADAAANHLMDVLDQNVPEAAQATQQMRDAYAAHSRMAEGLGEGWQSRLRDEIQTGTSNNRAQGVTNAYDTDEGVAGRQLGQTNQLLSSNALGGTPQSAVEQTINLARNKSPTIAENLGQNAADKIQAAAQAQTEGAENLASALRSAQGGDSSNTAAENLAPALLMLAPHTMVQTKMRFLQSLKNASFLPDGKAQVLAEMLFSQDPGLTDRAVNFLNTSTKGKGLLASLTGANVAAGAGAQNEPLVAPASPIPSSPANTVDYSKMSDADLMKEVGQAAPPDYSKMSDADLMKEVGQTAAPSAASASPYAPLLQQKYQNENPDLVSLIQRQKAQESSGDQSQVSKKGATGVMQVLPSTAPEAAKMAGVPWDPKAFKSDASYNELLGYAYMSNLLTKYGGNVAQALAAYNDGEGNVDNARATHGENFLSALPAETQDYVAKVGG